MNEPILQQPAEESGLWVRAPGWRNLAITATLLSAAAAASLIYLPQMDEPAPLARRAETPPPQIAAPPVQQAVTPALPPAKTQSAPQRRAPAKEVSSAPATQMVSLPAEPLPAPALQPAPVPAPATARQPGTACAINMPEQAQPMGGGTVVGFEAPAAAHQRMFNNERTNGGPINPAYANTPRAIVRMDGTPSGGSAQIVVLPPGVIVNVGDRITFNSSHRDMSMPCGFIPPLLAADSGPAQAAATPPASPQAGPSP